MARVRADQQLVPSVLDRLIGGSDATYSTEQPARAGAPRGQPVHTRPEGDQGRYTVERLKADVRRDLEWLLNTRCAPIVLSGERDELATSLMSYGIPDIVGQNLLSKEARQAYARRIQDTIRRFETRFRHVQVSLVDDRDRAQVDGTLWFRIEAVLEVQPEPLSIAFASGMEPATKSFSVREAGP